MTTVSLPAGATLRPLELPARADAGPTTLVREYAAVRNASLREATGRDDDAQTAESLLPMLRSDADMNRRQWYIESGGAIVGCVPLNIFQDEGAAIAIGTIALLRPHWNQGIGTAVLAFVEQQARAAGVRRLLSFNEHHSDGALDSIPSPTGLGSVPRDHSARFLERHGFHLEQVVRASALVWSDETAAFLEGLQSDAQSHAEDYRVVQWMLPTPEEHLDGYAWLKSRMSTDAPDAELGMPIETWDADRVRRHDARYAARGARVQVTAAEHIATGELCAFNELAIVGDDSAKTDQEDTLVLADHRGHRLGMLVKTAGLRTWRAQHPLSGRVVTYNAEENRPMLSINEAIGFTPVAYEGAWRKDLA
ncbi:GNAT family N-acetyltransferase [Microbacterium sp. H1-D42]|uniref:GNAT family N-acetyltransferase n=1 Tax=Microbacterium sp. H1-D42 TaxID=2925844 RepID=UPI001F5352C7|nr:GNAT family N-acetyltransferase [Microbacterium sp. H1-D42]UNK69396.1 GNAT family N-acetyltransferase [Microbacterium sp. H1-D42]